MIIRRKCDDRLLEARLNYQQRMGRHRDPIMEAQTGGSWYHLQPPEMAQAFEIAAASKVEMNQLAQLVEYGLEFAADFALTDLILGIGH
jgi:hypothetical protein